MKTSPILLAAACAMLLAMPASADLSNAIFAYTGLAVENFGTQDLILKTSSGPITLEAVDTGWYEQNGLHIASNKNYIAGLCGS